jgi:hypothetical protein
VIRGAVAVIGMVGLFLLVLHRVALPQTTPNCDEFKDDVGRISTACCCSNNCCSPAKESEFQHIEGDSYRVVATGQIVKRTGWSHGATIKCACDQIAGIWTKHDRAFVRCLYLPFPGS